jgi:predicted branched-subunit amino acid permease
MKKQRKERSYNELNHLYGRIFLAIAIIIIVMIPVIIALALKVTPDFAVIGTCMLSLIVFVAGGFIEVITYSPMLGTAGTYLGFFTGNLVNLKVPCAVNARELAGVEHGSKEGEIVSTISVATSTIVTTVIIALGVILLVPLTPVLENPVLTPAFDMAFTALFGALAYKYFVKDPDLVPIPLALALLLQGTLNLGTSVLIPVCSIVSILFAYWLFKKGKKLMK